MPSARPDRRLSLVLLGLVLVGAAGAGGWWWKENRKIEQRAIQLTGGDPARGKGLLRRYGCAGCHTIPGVQGAVGRVGPSLDQVAGRIYIAGVTENTAANLVRWLQDPPAVDPRTAMPRTGLSPREARDVAAFLYTLR